ncbi:MAG: 2-aminoethylphosphonate--pyruvate transaminase [Verrucomicrobia bacterium]|nr:2-aminoethylphosphonate--pyruvate transaminase [Verrucomicrobiota bacterium]
MNADKLLFTPGPLTTSLTVKQAMLRDLGSRDEEFIAMVRSIRERLLAVAGVSQTDGFEAIPMQGSGTFGVESVISSVIPADGKLLALVNGAYGERIVQMAMRLKIPVVPMRCAENETHDLDALRHALKADGRITHVVVVHCETTTGVLNPIAAIGRIVSKAGRSFIVDAMSSFGAIPAEMKTAGVDFLISSANKCIEGVPGFAIVIAGRAALLTSRGSARSLSLDLLAQWEGLEKTGQFRYTPPTHALLAFDQALKELDAEGGVAGRAKRYQANHTVIARGMAELGFRAYVPAEKQAPIITAFHYPAHAQFSFEDFYRRLSDKGFVIYPGKLTKVDCFRIGNIGRLYEKDMEALLVAIRGVLGEMNVPVPVA